MNTDLSKKWLAVGIILLFIGTYIIQTTAQDTEKSQSTSRGNWLYVGGSGPGNYSKIQDAIDNASDGDTVLVSDTSSPYFEHLRVNKKIILIGEDKETTIIDGSRSGNVINITSDDVIIHGFTIQQCGNYGCGLHIPTENNVITDNIIRNNSNTGIEVEVFSSNIIAYNIITNTSIGILINEGFFQSIYENKITNCGVAIWVRGPYFSKKEVTMFNDNDLSNNIYRNIITNDSMGIIIEDWSYTNIFENNITNNTIYGIGIFAYWLASSCYTNIFQNNINDNKWGIHLNSNGFHAMIKFCNIYENNIMYNKEGIQIISTDIDKLYGNVEQNNIYRNHINYNEKGINLSGIKHNYIYKNNFIGNTQSAYFVNSIFNRWTENYWDRFSKLPYPIFGKIIRPRFTIPTIKFDWHPAENPYHIPVMR